MPSLLMASLKAKTSEVLASGLFLFSGDLSRLKFPRMSYFVSLDILMWLNRSRKTNFPSDVHSA
jgi:hypothetical protein